MIEIDGFASRIKVIALSELNGTALTIKG